MVSDLIDIPAILADLSEPNAAALLTSLRWPDNVSCPRCGRKASSCNDARDRFRCPAQHEFTCTSATPLSSAKKIKPWLIAFFLAERGCLHPVVLEVLADINRKSAYIICCKVNEAVTPRTVTDYTLGFEDIARRVLAAPKSAQHVGRFH